MDPVEQVVVVVGATEPIGMAAVRAFLDDGAQVIGLDVDAQECAAAAAELAAAFGAERISFSVVELSNPESIERIAAEIAASRDRVDTLVYAATAMDQGGVGLVEIPLAEWHRVVDVNLTGVVVCVRGLLELLEGVQHRLHRHPGVG